MVAAIGPPVITVAQGVGGIAPGPPPSAPRRYLTIEMTVKSSVEPNSLLDTSTVALP